MNKIILGIILILGVREFLCLESPVYIATKQEKLDQLFPLIIDFNTMTKGSDEKQVRELFATHVLHDGITVVKFSASWCGPCKTYAPFFTAVAEQLREVVLDGRTVPVQYIAVDVDAVRVLAKDCSVSSVPTTIFYKNGTKVAVKVGCIKPDDLRTHIATLAR
jgi:thiol-disulfide isomerase/thioredoxin